MKHEYLTLNGKVVYEKIGEGTSAKIMIFSYDALGRPFAVKYSRNNGTKFTNYFYALNQQGNVVKIFRPITVKDADGNVTGYTEKTYATYTYDAWGRLIGILDSGGNNLINKQTTSTALANLNPLRYRGYYYDNETGFYYLQSRYYDPANRRFINADSYASTGQGFVGTNMFAYCNNNPVMYADPDGHSIIAIIIAGLLIASTLLLTGDSEKTDYIDPQKLPNPESGYKAPKKNPNPRKVPNPNGRGYGWPADDGGVWVPDNGMDGGPGWVVQYPGGRHEHHYPNGKVRTHKSVTTENGVPFGQKIVGTVAVAVVLLVIVGNDFFGVAYDDLLIPSAIEAARQLWK